MRGILPTYGDHSFKLSRLKADAIAAEKATEAASETAAAARKSSISVREGEHTQH